MIFTKRRIRSAPDVPLLAAPPPQPRRGQSEGDLLLPRLPATASVPPLGVLVSPQASHGARTSQAALRLLQTATEANPGAAFYRYLATCRDGVHAVRDFMMHSAWRHPERVGALLQGLPPSTGDRQTSGAPAPALLPEDTRAGTLVGVLYCALLEVATSKVQQTVRLPQHRHRLAHAEQRLLQALANAVLQALRARYAGQPARLRQLEALAALRFDEEADPELLRSEFKTLVHNLNVHFEGPQQSAHGFFHPMASLAYASYRHFEPNADPKAFRTLPLLPPAAGHTQAAQALAHELSETMYTLKLAGVRVAREGAHALPKFMDDIVTLLFAQPLAQRWATAATLCRALSAPKQGVWNGQQLQLMACLVHGAILQYAAHYLRQRHLENTSNHLEVLSHAVGSEVHAWTQVPGLRDQLDVISGQAHTGFLKRTPPMDIAKNLGEYGLMQRRYLEPHPDYANFGRGEEPLDALLSKPLECIMFGKLMYRIEDLQPLHPSSAHRQDEF